MNSTKHSRYALTIPVALAILMIANPVMAASLMGSKAVRLDLLSSVTYDGSATAISISTPLTSLAFGSTGSLVGNGLAAGGLLYEDPTMVQTQFANAETLLSVAMGSGGQAESQAAVGDVDLLPGTAYEVTADFVMSTVYSTLSGSSGYSDINNLQVAGMPVTVTGAPNQVVDVLGLATLVINEQTPTSNGMVVNALDLSTVGGVQVLVSSVSASVSSLSLGLSPGSSAVQVGHSSFIQPMHAIITCPDFVTGGGWITVTDGSGNDKGTFGFVAGCKNGGTNPRGNLEYHDHDNPAFFNVKATSVDFYSDCGAGSSPNCRTFSGDAEVNHVSGYRYECTVQDNGEPGKGSDLFVIQVFQNGVQVYSSLDAGSNGVLGGGNIKLHTSG